MAAQIRKVEQSRKEVVQAGLEVCVPRLQVGRIHPHGVPVGLSAALPAAVGLAWPSVL